MSDYISHPFAVDYFYKSFDTMLDLLSKHSDCDDILFKTLDELATARLKNYQLEGVIQRSREILFESKLIEYDHGMLALCLRELYLVLFKNRNTEEAISVLNYLKKILTLDMPAELHSMVTFHMGMNEARGYEGKVKVIKKILKSLTVDSVMYLKLFAHIYSFACRYGRKKDFDEKFYDKEKVLEKYFPERILLSRLNLSLELLDFENHDLISAKINKLSKVLSVKLLNNYMQVYQLITDRWQPSFVKDEKDLAYLHFESTYELQNGRCEEALNVTKKILLTGHSLNRDVSVVHFAVVRAELVNKKVDAAQRALLKSIESKGDDYIDDYFWARIELLKGNRKKATLHFKKAYEACRHYGALALFEYEMKLSYEVSLADMFDIGKSLSQYTKKDILHLEISKEEAVKTPFGIKRLVGRSNVIKDMKKIIHKYSLLDIPVLITGATGVGKDVVARALHEESEASAEPFIAINCGAISDSLLQSELFGHVAGAYTGAGRDHRGIFEEAGEGVVFLDEIGEVSPLLQVALLRVLETREIRPVGSAKTKAYQCRIIAATNAPLEKLVEEGTFRKDLLFRLKRLEISVPLLSDRVEDIGLLVDSFADINHANLVKPNFSSELMRAFKQYDWPGNIRELKNEIEKMRLIGPDKSYYGLEDTYLDFGKAPLMDKFSNGQGPLVKAISGIDQVLNTEVSAFRRIKKMRELFLQSKELTRSELMKYFKISPTTATRDLKKLMRENYIVKVEPTLAPRTHYFKLK